ncbi:histidine kinase [Actinomadura rubrisoli]|uniref:histidine kinase n=2 Tax=Actinomadura rubrisoli TaxID=2530368 RepID=A0A4R5AR43_9ACTN|nr:histidine kinase [Actinomadura rubrisoli]
MLPGRLASLDGHGPQRRTLRDWLVDLVLFGGAVWLWAAKDPAPHRLLEDLPGWTRMADLSLGAVGCLALWSRRRYPLALAWYLVPLLAVAPSATGAAIVAVLTVAVHRDWPLAALIAGLHLLVAVPLGLFLPPHGESGAQNAAWLVVMFTVPLSWGMAARARRELSLGARREVERQRFEHALRVADAERAERERIAREMHDVLAHRISLLTMHAGALSYRTAQAETGEGPPLKAAEIKEAVDVIHGNAHLALDELGEVLEVLRTADTGGRIGASSPSRPSLAGIAGLVREARAAGQQVVFEPGDTCEGREPHPRVQRTAYRVVQEGLTNARKHAPHAQVTVRVGGAPGAGLDITVVNPLPAEPRSSAIPGAGAGLAGLAERLSLDGGTLEHGPCDGTFRLAAHLPWP